MYIEQIVAVATLIASLSVKLIGYPNQIRRIRKAKQLDAVSSLYFKLSFVTYLLWTIHGILKEDLTLIIGQGIGFVVSGILVFVYLKQRKSIQPKQ
jgi:uncharacterized protein with PQ loop repeat